MALNRSNFWPKRRRWRVLIVALLAPVAIILLWLLSATIGSAIPVNAGWQPAAQGIRIYVADNGVHTGLVLPVKAAGVDWNTVAKPEDLRDPKQATASHISFGWGDRDFYVNTPSF